jgi:hypothetical protein
MVWLRSGRIGVIPIVAGGVGRFVPTDFFLDNRNGRDWQQQRALFSDPV